MTCVTRADDEGARNSDPRRKRRPTNDSTSEEETMTITGRGKTTRRGFLGTMSVAGAATVAAPLASAAQDAGVASSPSPTRMAQWYPTPAGANEAAPAE